MKKWTAEELERDLLIAATLVDNYGDEMRLLLERVEAEYHKSRKPPEVDRIKKMLAEHHVEEGQ